MRLVRLSRKALFKFVNGKSDDELQPAKEKRREHLRRCLDRAIELGRKKEPDEELAEWLRTEVTHGIRQFELLSRTDKRTGFSRRHTRLWFPPYGDYYLTLIELLIDPEVGPSRLFRCDYEKCRKYGVGRRNQRFCDSTRRPKDGKRPKSYCAAIWHMEARRAKT